MFRSSMFIVSFLLLLLTFSLGVAATEVVQSYKDLPKEYTEIFDVKFLDNNTLAATAKDKVLKLGKEIETARTAAEKQTLILSDCGKYVGVMLNDLYTVKSFQLTNANGTVLWSVSPELAHWYLISKDAKLIAAKAMAKFTHPNAPTDIIYLYNEKGSLIKKINIDQGHLVKDCYFTADGEHLVVNGVKLWVFDKEGNAVTEFEKSDVQGSHEIGYAMMDSSADGAVHAGLTVGRKFVDVIVNGKITGKIEFSGTIRDLSVAKNGAYIALVTDTSAYLYDLKAGNVIFNKTFALDREGMQVTVGNDGILYAGLMEKKAYSFENHQIPNVSTWVVSYSSAGEITFEKKFAESSMGARLPWVILSADENSLVVKNRDDLYLLNLE